MGVGFLSGGKEKVLTLILVMVAQLNGYSKTIELCTSNR